MTTSNPIPDLIAVILAGGNSSRMGKEKGELDWKGKPYLLHLKGILENLQLPVFLSCKKEQPLKLTNHFRCLYDYPEFADAGPMSGLLSSWKGFPDSNILLLGCDQFHLDRDNLEKLLMAAKETKANCTLVDPMNNHTEPFPAIYKKEIRTELMKWHAVGNQSLWKFLESRPLHKVMATRSEILKSFNAPEDFTELE